MEINPSASGRLQLATGYQPVKCRKHLKIVKFKIGAYD
jgi:hypothetical protein